MGHQVSVAYYTTTHGVTQQQQGIDTVYYGKTFKIAKELFSEDEPVDFEKEIGALVTEIEENGLTPILENSTIERYETWSMDGTEVWVMYRVPCKK